MNEERKTYPVSPVDRLHLSIADGGFTVELEVTDRGTERPHDRSSGGLAPTLRFKHTCFGHGSEIKIFPSLVALKYLAKFFTDAAAYPFTGEYCYPAYNWDDRNGDVISGRITADEAYRRRHASVQVGGANVTNVASDGSTDGGEPAAGTNEGIGAGIVNAPAAAKVIMRSEAVDALRELVAVKDLKDSEGKTEEYERRRVAAWAAARAALGS